MAQICKSIPPSPKKALNSKQDLDRLLDADFFKALGDHTRLNLLSCLSKCARPCTLSEIAECCQVDLSVVSRHMALLARSGIVQAKKQGRHIMYSTDFNFLVERFSDLTKNLKSYLKVSKELGCCE